MLCPSRSKLQHEPFPKEDMVSFSSFQCLTTHLSRHTIACENEAFSTGGLSAEQFVHGYCRLGSGPKPNS